ncbi:UNVERIFIED_CONTAM: hypothetical protein FKN15_076716 [Acipenser sinensis]
MTAKSTSGAVALGEHEPEHVCNNALAKLLQALESRRDAEERRREERYTALIEQAWIRHHNPDTLEEAVKLAEDFEDSLTSAWIGILSAPALRSSRPFSPSTPTPSSSPPSFQGPRPPRAPIPLGPLASPPWRPRQLKHYSGAVKKGQHCPEHHCTAHYPC